MGDDVPEQRLGKHERVGEDDFATLFAQLDRTEAVAPIDRGLRHLMTSIEALRRKPSPYRD